MLRFVLSRDRGLLRDDSGHELGRGAYACRVPSCVEALMNRNAWRPFSGFLASKGKRPDECRTTRGLWGLRIQRILGVSMAKVRVYELAKELSMDSKELVEKLKAGGISVKNYMSTLDEEVVAKAREVALGVVSEVIEEKRIRPRSFVVARKPSPSRRKRSREDGSGSQSPVGGGAESSCGRETRSSSASACGHGSSWGKGGGRRGGCCRGACRRSGSGACR